MKQLYLLCFFCVSQSILAQQVTGKLYDADATVKGAKITNTNTHKQVYTNSQGDFSIAAKINDTLVFSSLFHQPTTLIVKARHFNTDIVVELKKTVNSLDEVVLTNTPKAKIADTIQLNASLQSQIKNDIKNNPHLYAKNGVPPYGIDFIQVIGLVVKLFKKNKGQPQPPIQYATYKDFDSLFRHSAFFNKTLLVNTLKIPEEQHLLFFDYCDAQKINLNLFKETNQLPLLDLLLSHSSQYKARLKEVD